MPVNLPTPDQKAILQRGLQALSCNTLIALFLTLIGARSLWQNFVYAQCIGLTIWVLIDVTRTLLITDWATQRRKLVWIVPLCVVLGYVVGVLLAGQLMGDDAMAFTWAQPRKTLGMLSMSLVAGAVLTYYFLSREQLREARTRAEALQRQAAQSQLRLLQSQLEPHMLFNTLANLQALIDSDPARASDMLDRLIAYLRATLQASRATTHPLQTEFDRLGDYLALMAVRMGPRLTYTLDLPAALAAVPVPTLLLQPLVENSIKHALEPRIGGGSLRVSARQAGADLVLEVLDTGAGPAGALTNIDNAKGFGLAHVRERLLATYGSASAITFVVSGPCETCASITFPFKI